MTPDQMRDASLLDLFRLEAEAQKQVLDTGLLILERDPTNASQLEACMRAAHSLKGAARIVGLDNGVQVAHAMEDLLVAAQEGLLRLLPDHIDALLQGSDLLLRIGQAHRHVTFLPARHRLVCRRAEAHVEGQPHPRRRRGQAHGFAAEGVAARATGQLRLQPAAECGVQRVAQGICEQREARHQQRHRTHLQM